MSGRLVTGKGDYVSKRIFLPAAGYGGGSYLYYTGGHGLYWSSTPITAAWSLNFGSDYFRQRKGYYRYDGQSVRPLREFVESVGMTVHVALDTRTLARANAGMMEQICFSPVWETTADGAVATVSLNGVAVTNATEAGVLRWTPVQNGTYTFTHMVAVDGVQTGEMLSATINVRFSTKTTSVPVPLDWLQEFYPGTFNYEARAKETAANGHNTVEEAYVAGLDPTSATSELEATVVCSNGMVYVGWTPNLNTGAVTRIYTAYGRTDLTNGVWETPIQPWHRFFKVAVAMPSGAAGEETSVAGEGFVPQEKPLGGVQLWKDGPYWAECNVGASKPEEYGYYFWWGDTVGYKQDGGTWTDDYYYSGVTWVSSTGERMSESPFVKETCPTMNKDIPELQSLGYIDSTGKLVAEHDAATAHLGAPWRMPTAAEIDALISNCTTTWTTRNGVYGRLVTGTGDYAFNSIFLPAASTGNGTNIYYAGFIGGCWPSTPVSSGSNWYSMTIPSGSNYVWCLYFHSGTFERNYDYRYRGRSVRPLREFAQ